MTTRCAEKKSLADVELPILEQRRAVIRPSRSGWKRALVLLAVHALIAVHVAHWASTGRTVSPLEPSEAMEFSKHSVVNAGLIFFALTIGSTLVFGRWFCGWACHVVALQDASRWLLHKLRIRPRAVNLGLLAVVPWLAFVYMFLAPLVQRLLHGDSLAARATHLTTQSFWATFPSWPVALLTFVVCGFVIVYLLGSKGFCTYGCPYGAIFGVADQLAPMRIRVTDACEGCGHCTATCSSNVRVHQEVRDFGMVVDPGCMKCMDCVSVCPNDALYVGFGAPAVLARRRAGKPARGGRPWPGAALLLAFCFGTIAVLLGFNRTFEWRLASILTLLAFAVAWLFRGRAARTREHALWEEALLGALFLLALYAFRGFRGAVPLLLSFGLAAIFAHLVVQGLRMVYRPGVSLQRHVLKVPGKVTLAGGAFAALLLPVIGLSVYATRWQGAPRAFEEGRTHASANRFDDAITAFGRALAIDPGYPDARENLAGMLCASGRYAEGIVHLRVAVEQDPGDPDTRWMLARALFEFGDAAGARAELERAVRAAPRRADLLMGLAELCALLGDEQAAREHRESARRLLAPPPGG